MVIETDHYLTADEADEIKHAWRRWQQVAERYDLKVRPLSGTSIFPDYDVRMRGDD